MNGLTLLLDIFLNCLITVIVSYNC